MRLRQATALHFLVLVALSAFCVYQAAFNPSLVFAATGAIGLGLSLVAARGWAARRSATCELARTGSIPRETQLALLVYAGSSAALLVLIRQGAGLDDPAHDWTHTGIPAFLFVNDPGVSVYDKTHVRLALLAWVGFFAALAIIFSLWWHWLRSAFRIYVRIGLPTALFVPLAIVGSIALPPFWVDLPHWTVWLGPALDIGRGLWPYVNAPSGYGLLSAAVVAAWIHVFSVTQLSLALLASLGTVLAATFAYLLVSQVAHNKWVGLGCAVILLFGFYEPLRSIAAPSVGAFRWQLSSVAGLLCVWTSLSRRRSSAVRAGLAFGVLVLWDPPVMAFLGVAFLCVHVYRAVVGRDRERLVPVRGAAVSGLAVLAGVMLSAHWPADGLLGIVKRATATSAVYLEGFCQSGASVQLVRAGVPRG